MKQGAPVTKIIVNGRFMIHKVTGVERYARELLTSLDKIAKPGEIELVLPPGAFDVPEYKNVKVVNTGRLSNRMWEHISFPLYVKRRRGISLNLCNVAPLTSPDIVCIHDMKIKACPGFYSKMFLYWYRLLFRNETKRAKAILTVSEFSKSEIVRYYKINPKRVHVIYDAWQHYERIDYDDSTLTKYGLEKGGYYFSLFSLEKNKNFKWIADLAKKKTEQVFAVAGDINNHVFSAESKYDYPDNMKFLGYVGDSEAKTLCRDCKAFLFPTRYEGFGIPPLEAMGAGAKHVAVSDTEVMHEIFGDSVTYIDPDVARLELNEHAPEAIEATLEKYSWDKSAKRLYSLLGKIAGWNKKTGKIPE